MLVMTCWHVTRKKCATLFSTVRDQKIFLFLQKYFIPNNCSSQKHMLGKLSLFWGVGTPPGDPPRPPQGGPKKSCLRQYRACDWGSWRKWFGTPFLGGTPIFDCWTPKTHDHGLYKAYLPCHVFIFKMCCSHIAKFVAFSPNFGVGEKLRPTFHFLVKSLPHQTHVGECGGVDKV